MRLLTEHQIRMLRLHKDAGLAPDIILEGPDTATEVTTDTVSIPTWLFSDNPRYQYIRKAYAKSWSRS